MPNLLTSRRIPNKLLWISLSFLLPITVLLYFMIAGINANIRFAEQELAGNEYQRPLHDLSRHQALSGDAAAETELISEQGKIDQAFQKLDGVQRLLGVTLQVTDAGLAQRQRMPGQVAMAGLADDVLPLTDIAQEICRRTTRPRSSRIGDS